MVNVRHYPPFMIPIWVQPNAKKTEVMGLYADYVKIKLHAPAVDNKANDCLILFLSDSFKTAKSNIMLIKGQHQRKKKIADPTSHLSARLGSTLY